MKPIDYLSPYLPYMLKYVSEDFEIRYMDLSTDIGKFKRGLYKPIFHDLSDLTKEIEHKGEKFVPMEYGANNLGMELSKLPSALKNTGMSNRFIIERQSYETVSKLLEWHFNVFNLDPKLWININTL